jgi:hypothetical protein
MQHLRFSVGAPNNNVVDSFDTARYAGLNYTAQYAVLKNTTRYAVLKNTTRATWRVLKAVFPFEVSRQSRRINLEPPQTSGV